MGEVFSILLVRCVQLFRQFFKKFLVCHRAEFSAVTDSSVIATNCIGKPLDFIFVTIRFRFARVKP